jgi:IstB-like ATP binding protein
MAPLAEQLAALGLRYSATHLDDVVALATKRRWSPTQLLEHLVECEHQERTRRNLERRLARSRLGRFTPMSDFDWAWPKRIDRAAVDAVLRLEFLAEARNVVLVAAQGLGKTLPRTSPTPPCSPAPTYSSPPRPSSCWISVARSPPAPWRGASTTTLPAGSS